MGPRCLPDSPTPREINYPPRHRGPRRGMCERPYGKRSEKSGPGPRKSGGSQNTTKWRSPPLESLEPAFFAGWVGIPQEPTSWGGGPLYVPQFFAVEGFHPGRIAGT